MLAKWLPAAAVILAAVIGASRLFDPFSGDQALFLVGAKTLHAGGVLYRDFWDIKQPGIFAFFLAAGTLFGFTQIGAHALDVLWQTAFAVALVFGLRGALGEPRWAAFAPLAVVGATYAGSAPWHLLQVEELVGFPIFVCMWTAGAAVRGRSESAGLALVSGLAAGIVLLFKILLAPVVVAVTTAITFRARPRSSAAEPMRVWFIWLLGACIPLAIYAAYAMLTGSFKIAIETTFSVPFQVAAFAPHAPLARLNDSALRLLLYFRGIIVLAVIGAVTMRHLRMRPWRAACLAWIVSGLAVILAQAQSWWQYQFVLLVPPIGILATFGAAFLGECVARGRRGGLIGLAASGVVAYIAVPLPQGAIGTILRIARERPFISIAALERYRAATSTEYAGALVDATLPSRCGSDSGPIYVFGNPLIYVVANRPQAVAMTSWASYLFPPSIWARLDNEFSAARPSYIFVLRDRSDEISSARSPTISATVARDYVKAAQTADGVWYRRRDLISSCRGHQFRVAVVLKCHARLADSRRLEGSREDAYAALRRLRSVCTR